MQPRPNARRQLFRRFKADESSQSITESRRRISPEDNNERQAIHDHESAITEPRTAPVRTCEIIQTHRRNAAAPTKTASCTAVVQALRLPANVYSAWSAAFHPPNARSNRAATASAISSLHGAAAICTRDRQSARRCAAAHHRGRPSGHVVRHGVAEAAEVLVLRGCAMRQRGVRVDRAQQHVVVAAEMPASPRGKRPTPPSSRRSPRRSCGMLPVCPASR